GICENLHMTFYVLILRRRHAAARHQPMNENGAKTASLSMNASKLPTLHLQGKHVRFYDQFVHTLLVVET
ncbi:MAG: hypothetical protein KDE48_23930, partial [Anaerolineales bacterium]|nr:hypothetical protein [Anaerolineales bacterium]